MTHATFDHQKQTRSQGWGKPRRQRYVLVPVDRPQACRDCLPVMAGRRLRISDLLPNSAGLHGSAILSNFHPQRALPPYLRCHGRQVERIAPCRFRVLSNLRTQPSRQAIADVLETHPSSPFVGASFDDDDPTENSYGRVPHFKAELPQKRGELPHVCR